MDKTGRLTCPVCKNETTVRVQTDAALTKLPLFCPKCRHETTVHISHTNTLEHKPQKTRV